jgi:hypothetical protein
MDFTEENERLKELRDETTQMDPGQFLGVFDPDSDEDELEVWVSQIQEISGRIRTTMEETLVPGGLYRYTELFQTGDPIAGKESLILTYVGMEDWEPSGFIHGEWDHVFVFVSGSGRRWLLTWADSEGLVEEGCILFNDNNQVFYGLDRFERIA